MRLRFVSVPVAAALLYAAGCSILTSYDGYTGGGDHMPGAPDAAPEVDAALSPEQTLCLPEIPDQPKVGKPTITNALTYTGVVSQLRFIADDGGCPLGKNLDGLDTCPGPAACAVLGQAPDVDADLPCDGPGGIDNLAQNTLLNASFNGMMKLDLAKELPQDLAAQRTGFVLTLSGYGGELNNPQVNVAFYSDVGTANGGTVTDQAAVAHGHIITEASQAYVVNGVLVAHFDTPNEDGGTEQVPLHFAAQLANEPDLTSFVLPVSNTTILGIPIIDQDGGLTMHAAQLVGRLRSDDLVANLTSLYGCLDSADAPIVCSLFDLTDTPATDGKGPVCDAISLAVGFDLTPTVIVDAGPAIPSVNFCTEAGLPIATDICGASPAPPPRGDDAGDDDDAGDPTVDASDAD